jgi:Rps23 Pro-64 3,4-dihydroxylase Tpa1-like proline 4-hydroxylase
LSGRKTGRHLGATAAGARAPWPPHLLYRDFLPPHLAAELLAWAIRNEARFRASTVSQGFERVDARIRVSRSIGSFGEVKEELRTRLLAMAPGLIASLRVNPLEIEGAELEFVAHNDGAFYSRHIDTAIGERGLDENLRFISAAYYVHRQPKAFSGGMLRLHQFGAQDAEGSTDITPEHNLLVVFPSWALHEVTPVGCPSRAFADSRFAVNIWIYSRPRGAGAPARSVER